MLLCLVSISNIFDCYMTPAVPAVTMHGVGAEDGVHQRPAGAQSDPTRGHVPERGAGGEQEELPEESSSPGGSGRVPEGETPVSLTPEEKKIRREKFGNGNTNEFNTQTWLDSVQDVHP